MIQLGVIGHDEPEIIHFHGMKGIPELHLVGYFLYERVAQNGELIQPVFKNADRLIEKADALSFLSGGSQLLEMSEKALKSSCHVFLNRINELTIEEIDHLYRIAEEADVTLMVRQAERYNPALLSLSRYIKNPSFIEISKNIHYDGQDAYAQDKLLSQVFEGLNVIMFRKKTNIKRINVHLSSVFKEAPDLIHIRLEFDNGAAANMSLSYMPGEASFKIQYFQKDEILYVDMNSKQSIRKKVNQGTQIMFEEPLLVLNGNSILDEMLVFSHAILKTNAWMQTIHQGYDSILLAHRIVDKILERL